MGVIVLVGILVEHLGVAVLEFSLEVVRLLVILFVAVHVLLAVVLVVTLVLRLGHQCLGFVLAVKVGRVVQVLLVAHRFVLLVAGQSAPLLVSGQEGQELVRVVDELVDVEVVLQVVLLLRLRLLLTVQFG